MLGLKRCYGCGRLIMSWSETVDTEKVGVIHKACVHEALVKYEKDEEWRWYKERVTKRDALRAKEILGLK